MTPDVRGTPGRRSRGPAPPPREVGTAAILRSVVALALVVWIVQGLLGSTHGVARIVRLRRENAALETREARLAAERDSLARVESLQTSPLYLEGVAREQYGLARPGEIVYRIRTKADSGGADSTRSGGGQ